jgi:hypothetical protein
MTDPQAVNLTPAEAANLLRQELDRAAQALDIGDLDAGLDGYVRALGLALQLGPAPAEEVLVAALEAAQKLAAGRDAAGLSALGPALVELVDQMQAAGALPPTAVMAAWATVTADVGGLIGQAGLILTLPPDHRQGLVHNAQTRATLLDEATGHLFQISAWLGELDLAS